MENIPWVEKYRPKTLNQVFDREEIIEKLKFYVKTLNMPNLLFTGPPGVGKTVCAIAFVNDLFLGRLKNNFLELNASDERGIDTVRGIIKEFARIKPNLQVPFKIIYLDECDSMTISAQHALRRIIEQHTHITRFILSCNYLHQIIEPIQSRCAIFRFAPYDADLLKKLLINIAVKENLNLTEDGLSAIISFTNGDLRYAINTLEIFSNMKGAINDELVFKILGKSNPRYIRNLLSLALKGKLIESCNNITHLIEKQGISGLELIEQIHNEIFNLDTNDYIKINLLEIAGEVQYRICMGADDLIQLHFFISHFINLLSSTNKKH